MTVNEWFDIALRIIDIAAWPVTILVLVFLFRPSIASLIKRVTKVQLPGGGGIEAIPVLLVGADPLKEKVAEESIVRKSKPKQEIDANKLMAARGLIGSVSGLDLDLYRTLIEKNPTIALAGIRIELESMLKNVAMVFGLEVNKNSLLGPTIERLFSRRMITESQRELIEAINKICDVAAHGSPVDKDQAYKVLEMARVLKDDYVSWLEWGFKS